MTIQLFLNGHCFDQYRTTMPRSIAAQVKDHLDAGWRIHDARRFRIRGESRFHVSFVRGEGSTAAIVATPQRLS